jgi:hypothetical protein
MGAAWFDTLAEELAGGGYGATAHEAYFQEQQQPLAEEQAGRQRWRARAVLVDMEPKVCCAWLWGCGTVGLWGCVLPGALRV